jgi:putative SOS response-associated peptidase YedK
MHTGQGALTVDAYHDVADEHTHFSILHRHRVVLENPVAAAWLRPITSSRK